MNEKCIILGVCFLVMVAGAVNAEIYTWFGGTGDWADVENWDPNSGPPNSVAEDTANLYSFGGSGLACNIMDGSSFSVLYANVGGGVEDQITVLDINVGGSLSSGAEVQIGPAAGTNSVGVLEVHGTAGLASLRVAGEDPDAVGVVNIDGGRCNVSVFGTYIGTSFVAGDHDGYATVNISNLGVLQIDGLGVYGNRLDIGSKSVINVSASGGTLKVNGDWETQLQGYLDNGRLAGEGNCLLFYDSGDDYTYYVCGPVCSTYLDTDLNTDCYVNLKDLALLAKNWLDCSRIDDPECTP